MVKQIKAYNWSSTFLELLQNKEKTLDIDQYDFCLNEWKSAHEGKMIKNYFLTIITFSVGLWAVWQHSIFLAVLLIALAANFNRQSSHHILITEIMSAHRLLAMLINKQTHQIIRSHRTGQVRSDA